jgi:hypothetical protein
VARLRPEGARDDDDDRCTLNVADDPWPAERLVWSELRHRESRAEHRGVVQKRDDAVSVRSPAMNGSLCGEARHVDAATGSSLRTATSSWQNQLTVASGERTQFLANASPNYATYLGETTAGKRADTLARLSTGMLR